MDALRWLATVHVQPVRVQPLRRWGVALHLAGNVARLFRSPEAAADWLEACQQPSGKAESSPRGIGPGVARLP
jgi:hypothetical protein